ncbi:protein outspread, partial [Plakobranchus ocellatus]
ASRKVTKCGYLFVSPGYDFSNPLDRTRRWQRRLFRLYDDGELTYCVDENPDTVPQGSVDMNKCTDVLDAESTTTHPNSLAVVTPERTLYIKSTSREEIQWWQDTLAEFPKALKAIKPRRKQPFLILSNKENQEDAALDLQSAKGASGAAGAAPQSYSTFRGVRSMKHRSDQAHQEGLRKSSSLHDLSSTAPDGSSSSKDLSLVGGTNLTGSRFLSRSGDRLDVLGREKSFSLSSAMSPPREQRPGLPVLPHPPTFTMPRSTWTRTGQPSPPTFLAPPSKSQNPRAPSSTASSSSSASTSPRRSSFDDRPPSSASAAATSSRGIGAASAAESRKFHRERSSSLKEFPGQFSLLPLHQQLQPDDVTNANKGNTSRTTTSSISDRGSVCSMSADETDSNETDELKMARSSELHVPSATSGRPSFTTSFAPSAPSTPSNKYEDLYMKKGWLIKQGLNEKESKKHWFVLGGNSLRYYQDAKSEESNMLDGRIDLSTCYEVSELPTHRNYGFKIKTANGEYTLAAMTMGIRNNWMKAIRLCMELHNTDARRSRGSPAYSKSPPRASMDDLEFKSGAAASSTAAVTGAGGETAFQLIGRRDAYKRDTQKPARRHHSDVNPGNVSSALSVREFPVEIDSVDGRVGENLRAKEPFASSSRATRSLDSQATAKGSPSTDRVDLSLTPRASKIARHRSPSNENLTRSSQRPGPGAGDTTGSGRYVEGSDSVPPPSTASLSGTPSKSSTASSSSSATPKRGITSESNKEEVKREMMRRAKSPSARVRDKTRAAKTPRLHSPVTLVDKGFSGYHHPHHHMAGSATASDTGSAMSDTAEDPAYADVHMSEDEYPTQEDTDIDEVGSATASDVVGGGDEALVEILETEVESLKDRLEHTQTELDQVHKDNMDLKSRLHKEATQSVDSGYSASSRWGQQSDIGGSRYGQANSAAEVQTLKRQLKDSRDTVQRQRMEIDGLKSRLDMSVSKLTGTEKALSEALRDYKQEKDKFMKMSSEWNRRIRTMEGQHKDTVHKLELSRESLQAKERESRRLEAEVKTNLQKTRDQEREILKLKAVEHEYKQLKEKLDDREHEVTGLRAQLKEKDQWSQKQKEEYERQIEALDHEYRLERDDLESHLEQLKGELYHAHDRQASLSDNMTLNMADMLREKDDIIAQLEEKLIEADKKMVDLSDELHAEMGENADLSHSLSTLRQEKQSLGNTITQLEAQLVSVGAKVQSFESDNFSLNRQLEELRAENTQLHDGLVKAGGEKTTTDSSSTYALKSSQVDEDYDIEGRQEKEKLKKIIVDLNAQIQELQHQLERADTALEKTPERASSTLSTVSSVSSVAESLANSSDHQQDLLHTVLVVDSQLKEINNMLLTLRQSFDAYLDTLKEDPSRLQGNKLAELIEDIGHKCQGVQDTLRESPEEMAASEDSEAPDYKHVITVGPSSGGQVIMREYKGLKLKFDQAVAELRKLRRDVREANTSYETVRGEDKKLKEVLGVMEGAYKQQIVELIARVDGLSEKIVNVQPGSIMESQASPAFPTLSQGCDTAIQQIEQQLNELDNRISSLERQARNLQHSHTGRAASAGGSSVPSEAVGLTAELNQIKSQLNSAIEKLKPLSSMFPSQLEGKVESCKQRIGSLSASLQSAPSSTISQGESSSEAAAASAGVSNCLSEIREQVREIGEQLDSLEEGDEDSDSEDDGEQTTVEDIREKLAHLTEYIEEHSKLSTSDWALLRLVTLQKASSVALQETQEPMETDSESAEKKLKLYADKISLEAVLLYEMAHILQTKDCLSPEDSVCREIDCLNSQLMSLHHKLDMEIKTMHFEEPQADLLSCYVELMAEKILINGQIFADSFDQRSHLGKVSVEASSSVQPVILATEALVRSQIDSFISSNMDNSVSEIMSLPTHLSLRAVVQSELTYALAQLKHRLAKNPQALQPGPANYKFSFERLLERQRKVFTSIENYEKQLSNSLAVIIFKESEEMTIVEGPESVLEAMCSDLSTIMETHIQFYKEKCRSALDTHSAHKYDLTVNELRQCRESVLLAIKSQHEAYAKDPTSVRDSSLDIPVQSLDNTIANFGDILSLKAVVAANSNFLLELLKMGNTVLSELELEQDAFPEDSLNIEKGLTTFINNLTEALEVEALSKATLSKQFLAPRTHDKGADAKAETSEENVTTAEDLRVPELTVCSDGQLSSQAQVLVREAVFGAQLTLSLFKQKLLHEREMQRLKVHRPLRAGRERPRHTTDDDEEDTGLDSDGTLEIQNDFQALLVPLEEVLESKHEDELEVLQVLLGLVSQIVASCTPSEKSSSSKASSSASMSGVEDQLRQLEQKLQHELEIAEQRHTTHLEVFKQESSRLEKTLEDQAQDRDHFEDRVAQLEEDLATVQLQHEEEKERVKQDILTAVHAIRSNEEKSETNLAQKASRLGRELAVQKLNFRKILGSIKTDLATKDKTALTQSIEEHIKGIPLNPEEDEDEDYQPPLPSQPPPIAPAEGKQQQSLEEHVVEVREPELMLNLSHHEHEVEQLKKEKDEALAEEMRNTKAALDAVRSAYEDELTKERSKYKEALLHMYTEEYINEIRMRHMEEEDRMREELQKVNLHYTSKCEDYKLLEMKLQQTKHDFESHINQLIASNDHLEGMLNTEIENLKEFIKNKPSSASLTTGSATMEEELYDSKIMVRVKDAELQKLRSQVKNLENSLHRTTEEQRQTMTQYMQALKKSGEMKNQYQEEVAQLTEKLHKVLGSQGLKANIRRTPSFHQRARSPSPQGGTSPRKEADHSSRDSHRRRHIQPKDLRRSKSSPSLPYVFDGKVSPAKLPSLKPGRRSRSPKT